MEEAPQSIRMKGLVMVPENPSLGTSRTDIVSEQNERQIQQHMPTISQDIHVREFHVSKTSEKDHNTYVTVFDGACAVTSKDTKRFLFIIAVVSLLGGIALTILYNTTHELRDVIVIGVGFIIIGAFLLSIALILILKDFIISCKD